MQMDQKFQKKEEKKTEKLLVFNGIYLNQYLKRYTI